MLTISVEMIPLNLIRYFTRKRTGWDVLLKNESQPAIISRMKIDIETQKFIEEIATRAATQVVQTERTSAIATLKESGLAAKSTESCIYKEIDELSKTIDVLNKEVEVLTSTISPVLRATLVAKAVVEETMQETDSDIVKALKARNMALQFTIANIRQLAERSQVLK